MTRKQQHARADVAGWIWRGLIAALFVYIGWGKFDSAPNSEWVRIFAKIGFGQWFRIFTGVVELGGGVLYLFPKTNKIGAAQSTADTTRATITGVAQTAAVDTALFQFLCHVRTVSATGQVIFNVSLAGKQAANAVGFGSSSVVNIPATFDNTGLQGQYVGIAIDPVATGTPVWTIDMVECKLSG